MISATADLDNALVKRSTKVLTSLSDDRLVLFDLRSSRYFTFNEVGTALWQQMGETGALLPRLVEGLTSTFDVSTTLALRDTHEFVQTLVKLGLVELRRDVTGD